MPAPTDIYRELRAAVKAAVAAALTDAGVTVTVYEQDALDFDLMDEPAVVVLYNGREQRRPGGTNVRPLYAYPFLIGLHTLQGDPDVGAAGNEPPGLRPTLFAEIVRRTFDDRRAITPPAGIAPHPSEYDPLPPVYDEGSPSEVQKLRSVVGVTVPALVPRGG